MFKFFKIKKTKRTEQKLVQLLPNESKAKMKEFLKMLSKDNTTLYIYRNREPGVNARSYPKVRKIGINTRWIKELSKHPEKELADAFFLTLGHEYTHIGPELPQIGAKLNKADKYFIHQFNEVYADFNGILLMLDGDRELALNAMNRKTDFLNSKNLNSSLKPTHPSWDRRIFYIKNFDFNSTLIRRLAADTGCKNKELIRKAIQTHPEFTLH